MKIGVIADIHGNAPALQAALDAIEEYDVAAIVCLGDIVGVLGSPNKCVSLVRDHTDYSVYGNHDSRVFHDRTFLPQRDPDVFEYELLTEQLSETNKMWLENRPAINELDNGILLAHSRPTPGNAIGIGHDPGVYPRSFADIAGSVSERISIVLLGHTHCQHSTLVETEDKPTLVCNPGAVGLHFQADDDGQTGRTKFAVIDTNTKECLLRSVQYDSTSVVTFLTEHGSPLGMTTDC